MISLGVSVDFHLLIYLVRGVEAAFAAAMFTVPVVWLIGFAVNSAAAAIVRNARVI